MEIVPQLYLALFSDVYSSYLYTCSFPLIVFCCFLYRFRSCCMFCLIFTIFPSSSVFLPLFPRFFPFFHNKSIQTHVMVQFIVVMVFIFLYLYCLPQNEEFVLRLHQHLCQNVRITSSGTAVWPFVFILLTFPCLCSVCFLFLASTLLSNITRIAEPLTSHQVTLCVVLTADLARIPSLS